jgi:hypothetical protein
VRWCERAHNGHSSCCCVRCGWGRKCGVVVAGARKPSASCGNRMRHRTHQAHRRMQLIITSASVATSPGMYCRCGREWRATHTQARLLRCVHAWCGCTHASRAVGAGRTHSLLPCFQDGVRVARLLMQTEMRTSRPISRVTATRRHTHLVKGDLVGVAHDRVHPEPPPRAKQRA